MGFDPEKSSAISDEDQLSPHHMIYLQLQQRIQKHIEQQENSVLVLSEKPVGGFDWQPSPVDASIQPMNLTSDELTEQ